MMGKLKKLTGYRLFLPLSCLIIVLLINLITTPTFFRITINNGVLYGYIIDVINRASELVVLAVGMTLVVSASAGTDISVGAVMAVAAAVCTRVLAGGEVSSMSMPIPTSWLCWQLWQRPWCAAALTDFWLQSLRYSPWWRP